MTTPPNFVSGAILTAAQMSSVGSWLIKQQTVGSGVGSVNVTNAFTADYDSYKIIWSGGALSGNIPVYLQLGSSTTTYNWGLIYNVWSTGAVAGVGSIQTGVANYFGFAGAGDTTSAWANIELVNPFKAEYTHYFASSYGGTTTSGTCTGVHRTATSYTDFTLTADSGAMTGGVISVYGFKGSTT